KELTIVGISTYLEVHKKMISAGTLPKIVEKLVTWLTTEPDRKGKACSLLIYRLFSFLFFSFSFLFFSFLFFSSYYLPFLFFSLILYILSFFSSYFYLLLNLRRRFCNGLLLYFESQEIYILAT